MSVPNFCGHHCCFCTADTPPTQTCSLPRFTPSLSHEQTLQKSYQSPCQDFSIECNNIFLSWTPLKHFPCAVFLFFPPFFFSGIVNVCWHLDGCTTCNVMLYACAKELTMSSLEHLGWELDHKWLFPLFILFQRQISKNLKIITETGKSGVSVIIRKNSGKSWRVGSFASLTTTTACDTANSSRDVSKGWLAAEAWSMTITLTNRISMSRVVSLYAVAARELSISSAKAYAATQANAT